MVDPSTISADERKARMRHCETCRFYIPYSNEQFKEGNCHRGSPSIDPQYGHAAWPPVKSIDGCGSHMPLAEFVKKKDAEA